MRVHEVLNIKEGKSLIAPSSFDKKGKAMKLPSMYQNKDWGKAAKVSPQTVTVKSSGKDGKIYGRRTLIQK